MAQIAQLSEAEIEARFHIAGPRQVAFLLQAYIREATPFSVQFRSADGMFLTTLLAVSAEKGELVFDCSGSPETNRDFLQSERNLFVGRPDGIHVQFAVGRVQETLFAGARAFVTHLPERVLRLQRRETFRVETPRLRPLKFFGRLADGGLLSQPVHDISVAGVGLNAVALPEGIEPGTRLGNCHFALPDDAHELFCAAAVRHLTETESRSGMRHWRLGLAFDKLPPADEARIQRYIVRVERERHELSA